MTKIDVRNYFEKIYGVKVATVHTRIQKGKLRRDRKQPAKFVKKSSDTKVAYLTLVNTVMNLPLKWRVHNASSVVTYIQCRNRFDSYSCIALQTGNGIPHTP